MSFVHGKVAIVTGGASGIGFEIVKNLLKTGIKGVTLVDVNPKGLDVTKTLSEEFGPNRIIFHRADVTIIKEFEDAFKKTIDVFKNIDILFNNAGICNDADWEREIAININGVVNGCLLGFDKYIPKYKSGPEGVILNTASITGLDGFSFVPIYSATKHAVVGLTRSWGCDEHYNRTHVRMVAICPGVTSTPLIDNIGGRNLGPDYETMRTKTLSVPHERAANVAKGAIKVVEEGENGSVWVSEDSETYEVELFDRKLLRKK